MIKQLCELAERENLVDHPALTKLAPTILINLDDDGNCRDVVAIDKKEAKEFLCESVTRARNVLARVLVDNSEYLLGIKADDSKTSKDVTPEDKYKVFIEKNSPYLNDVPQLQPLLKFYTSNMANGIEKAKIEFSKLDKKVRTGSIAFYLPCGKYAHDLPSVLERIKHDYDVRQNEKLQSGVQECSVCARREYPIELTHERIKRIPDGQPSGNALVSYNSDAFRSYGLMQNENSKICSDCAKHYVSAMNWLLEKGRVTSDEKGKEKFVFAHRKNLGRDTAILFWQRDESDFDLMDFLDAPQDDEVAKLLSSPDSGRYAALHLEENLFYAITLSGSAARIALRDWIEISLPQTKMNLKQWFRDIEISDNQQKVYTALWKMSNACKGTHTDDPIAARVQTILWRCAIKNQIVPLWVLSAVINRIRADSSKFKWKKKENSDLSLYEIISCARIALIKLTINRLNREEKQIMSELDFENKNVAYLCGRLLSVLADVQHASLPDVNAGVVDRFYSSASTTPSAAFGRLIKNAQYHLSKLRSEKPGLAVNLEKKITEIMEQISDFPQTLRLEDQGRFAIGFYHQQQLRFKSNQ